MPKYDDLFDATAPDDSLFINKSTLDSLAESAEVHAQDAQDCAVARSTMVSATGIYRRSRAVSDAEDTAVTTGRVNVDEPRVEIESGKQFASGPMRTGMYAYWESTVEIGDCKRFQTSAFRKFNWVEIS